MGMNEIFFSEAVLRIIRERREIVYDSLIHNQVKSMEHYRELMGMIDSLNHVEQELKSLLEKQERSIE
jgi:hypothetical protein|tara:strand:- start:200 stop:403 length:204 start_codon:yes stop_codon:yes gene_type:complete